MNLQTLFLGSSESDVTGTLKARADSLRAGREIKRDQLHQEELAQNKKIKELQRQFEEHHKQFVAQQQERQRKWESKQRKLIAKGRPPKSGRGSTPASSTETTPTADALPD